MVAYRFQPGALDIIAQEKRLTSEQALATALGITTDQLGRLRHGATVGAPMALHVSTLMDTPGIWHGLTITRTSAAA